jgi:hypothetical protein
MIKIASIIIRGGKAYLPVSAKVEGGGPYVLVEPVFTANLTVDDLTAALERIIAAGHPPIPPLTRDDWRRRKDPLLAAAGVKSWKQLATDSRAYALTWEADKITLYLHDLDEQGRFAAGPGRFQTFPSDTPLRTIVAAILEDASKQAVLGRSQPGAQSPSA